MSARVKRPRTRRARSRKSIVLTERCYDLLALVGLCRVITTAQAARDLFPSEDRARRRIRELFDAGLLNVSITTSQAANLLTSTRAGLDRLIEVRPALSSRVALAGAIRTLGLRRHLVAVDARLFAASLGGARLLRWSPGAGEHARAIGLEALKLRPDAVAELRTPTGAFTVAIELDLDASEAALASRLGRYRDAVADGGLDALWIAFDGGPSRAATLRRLAGEPEIADAVRLLPMVSLAARPAELPPSVAEERRAVGPGAIIAERSRDGEDARESAGARAADGSPDGRADGR